MPKNTASPSMRFSTSSSCAPAQREIDLAFVFEDRLVFQERSNGHRAAFEAVARIGERAVVIFELVEDASDRAELEMFGDAFGYGKIEMGYGAAVIIGIFVLGIDVDTEFRREVPTVFRRRRRDARCAVSIAVARADQKTLRTFPRSHRSRRHEQHRPYPTPDR
jgi:hypothetical protein